MSQMTAVRPPKRTGNSLQWWNLSILTGGFDVEDAIIEELVTPLAAQSQLLGAPRWFFTRVEQAGIAGVRVRILTPVAAAERLQAFFVALQHRVGGVLPQLTVSQHFSIPAGELSSGSSTDAATENRLQADLAVFGGTEGLQLAEEVFEISSDLAAWATRRFPKAQNRSAFGSLLLFDAARAMMRGPRAVNWPDRRRLTWDFYWDTHFRSCTLGLGLRGGAREALTASVAARTPAVHGLMAATAADSAVQNWRRRWSRSIDSYLYRADRARASRSAQQLTVCQAHMLLNRLGVRPHEEAALGAYARAWSPELEAGQSGRY